MGELEKKDHHESVGAGLITFVFLFIVAFLAFKVFTMNHPGHWLATLSGIIWYLFVFTAFLWTVTRSVIKSLRRRAEDRRFRKERDEGLNGPADQR